MRLLRRNLPSAVLLEKIRVAERRFEAGERELGFYLLDLKRRKLQRHAGCSSFQQFVMNRTGLTVKKARELVRAALALETLPLLDEAFSRGELRWSSVRTLVKVATPQTEAGWLEWARGRRVAEVERRVASARAGEDPGQRRWGGSPTRYPYHLQADAALHQAIESLARVLSLKEGTEVPAEEAIERAVLRAVAEEVHGLRTDGGPAPEGEPERKLPSSYRLVVQRCPDCERWVAATPEGPAEIPAERGRALAEGAEILSITPEVRAERGAENSPKCPTWDIVKTEVVEAPRSLIGHSQDLSTVDRAPVPADERDLPCSAELVKLVLSRDGSFCRIPGCGAIAETVHHIIWRSHGGPSTPGNCVGLCSGCHDRVHAGDIIISGPAGDLKVSGRDRRPLLDLGNPAATTVLMEVEAAPVLEREAPEPARTRSPLPDEMSPDWWRAHRGAFEWSERRKVFVLDPEKLSGCEEPGEEPARATKGSPDAFCGFIGQSRAVRSLSLAIRGALQRGETPRPVLLTGPPGLGKTSLARRAAAAIGTSLHVTAGGALGDPGALVGILADLARGDVLFIDEVHGMPRAAMEQLYSALDEGWLPITVVHDGAARVVKLQVRPFLLIAATTEEDRLAKPFRARFLVRERLDLYSTEELAEIARRRAGELSMDLGPGAAEALARGSRGTPRELVLHLHRARDLAQSEGGSITAETAARALEMAGIDRHGLSEMDRRLLRALADRGRPVGLRTLADLLGESLRALLELHEPHLLREGYLARTRHGRVITPAGRAVAGGSPPAIEPPWCGHHRRDREGPR